jgi:hypothetical protein
MTVEMNKYEFRQEIVDMVASEGYRLNLPTEEKEWNQRDKEIIKDVAWKYWIEWRTEAERKVEILTKRVSQNNVPY